MMWALYRPAWILTVASGSEAHQLVASLEQQTVRTVVPMAGRVLALLERLEHGFDRGPTCIPVPSGPCWSFVTSREVSWRTKAVALCVKPFKLEGGPSAVLSWPPSLRASSPTDDQPLLPDVVRLRPSTQSGSGGQRHHLPPLRS